MNDWLQRLDRHVRGDAALRDLAAHFGEFSRELITEHWGYESQYFVHDGDLTLSDATAAFAALCEHAAGPPVLIVDGDLHLSSTLDAAGILFAVAVTGNLVCQHLLAESCALSVGGDLHVDGLFSSTAGHGLVNVDGTVFARFERADDESYDVRFAPDVLHLSQLVKQLRPECLDDRVFTSVVDAGGNPFLVAIEDLRRPQPAPAPAPATFEDLVCDANRCVDSTRADEAIALYEQALALAPDATAVCVRLAGLLITRDQERAKRLADTALDDRRERDKAAAVLELLRLREVSSNDSRASPLFSEGWARMARLDFAAAAEHWLEARRAAPNFGEAQRALAALFVWLGSSHPVTQEFGRLRSDF